MIPETWLGIFLSLSAGIMAGTSMLPLKWTRKWAWENTWLVFSTFSLFVLPWLLAFLTIKNPLGLYSSLLPHEWLVPFFFGFGWGIAQVMFGISIARLGMALSYAIIVGLISLLGTLVPLFVQHRAILGTWRGASILVGLTIMLAGIVASAIAGRSREHNSAVVLPKANSYGIALLIAVIAGLLGPMLNYSFAFGQSIAQHAVEMGTQPQFGGYAIWPVGLAGGLLPNFAYSIYLLNRRGSWGLFAAAPKESAGAVLMAVLWMGAFAVYAIATVFIGSLGTSVGWALLQIFMIITASLSGVFMGEWIDAPRKSRKLLWIGLALLATATVLIALGNSPTT
jgi:L-rhamnose-H+ transport protein